MEKRQIPIAWTVQPIQIGQFAQNTVGSVQQSLHFPIPIPCLGYRTWAAQGGGGAPPRPTPKPGGAPPRPTLTWAQPKSLGAAQVPLADLGVSPSPQVPLADLGVSPSPSPQVPLADLGVSPSPQAPLADLGAAQVVIEDVGEILATETEDLFTEFVPSVAGPAHPSRLVSTTTLIYALPAADPSMIHHSFSKLALSAAQREAVCFARARCLEGNALLIADGTGVGKGRELAAFLLNHRKFESATRFLFVTASSSLEADFRRDLKAVGWPILDLPLRALTGPPSNRIVLKRGVLFLTYSLLRSKPTSSGGRSRLAQVTAWLRQSNSPAIAFDEIHAAKGNTATNLAVVKLQSALPNAAIVYASATAASTPQHLACMPRLGLWGDQKPFGTVEEFLSKIGASKSASTMELVATELASRGGFVSRRLSFFGSSFETLRSALTNPQQKLHASLCEWFSTLYATGLFNDRNGTRYFWGTHLRFFKALLVGFRVGTVAERAKLHLESGGQVVVSLTSTGEAAAEGVDDCVEEGGFVALKTTLHDLIGFCRRAGGATPRPNGQGSALPNTPLADLGDSPSHPDLGGAQVPPRPNPDLGDSPSHPDLGDSPSREAQVSQDQILQLESAIESFDLPPSPLDALLDALDQLGHGVVELTGRSHAWKRTSDPSSPSLWKKEKRTASNTYLNSQFQAGIVKCAVISAAASTGISMHDTKENEKSRPRLQIIVELPYAADA